MNKRARYLLTDKQVETLSRFSLALAMLASLIVVILDVAVWRSS